MGLAQHLEERQGLRRHTEESFSSRRNAPRANVSSKPSHRSPATSGASTRNPISVFVNADRGSRFIDPTKNWRQSNDRTFPCSAARGAFASSDVCSGPAGPFEVVRGIDLVELDARFEQLAAVPLVLAEHGHYVGRSEAVGEHPYPDPTRTQRPQELDAALAGHEVRRHEHHRLARTVELPELRHQVPGRVFPRVLHLDGIVRGDLDARG